MTNEEFIKEVFEILFGDGARCVENNDNEVKAREFTKEEAIDQIIEYIDHSLKYEEEKESCKAIFEKEPEKPITPEGEDFDINKHFDQCIKNWGRHG